ncbi:hypothetical protein SAMN05428949_6720 [Chitinophaga sp. YR627]|nr:hypothetical protein SAMN05428949_6720 [Chitinophaga sp. YR627]
MPESANMTAGIIAGIFFDVSPYYTAITPLLLRS